MHIIFLPLPNSFLILVDKFFASETNDDFGIDAFNKNLLSRINQELGADFNQSLFRHIVRFNTFEGRVEMHLESCVDQVVNIGKEPSREDTQKSNSKKLKAKSTANVEQGMVE